VAFDSLIDGVFDACCQVGVDGALLGGPLTEALSLSIQAVVLRKRTASSWVQAPWRMASLQKSSSREVAMK
jgi:hypothetical protein